MKVDSTNSRYRSYGNKYLFLLFLLGLLTACASIFSSCTGNEGQVSDRQETSADTALPKGLSTIEETVATGKRGPSQRRESPGEADLVRDGVVEVDEMSLRELVGQMFVVSVSGTESDYYIEKMIRERNIGGVLFFGYNMRSEAQTRALVDSLQSLAISTEPDIPLFIAVDQEGGEVSSAPWVAPQPAAAEVGARGDPEEAREISAQIGNELRRAGINTNFAPVVDTGFGAAIEARSYGEDPTLVARMGTASIEGFQFAAVVSAAKHFPNHGVAATDSHVGFPVVEHDMQTVLSYDLPPFRAAVEADVPMVMMGHLIYPAIDPERPASLSPQAIQLLREELNFDGVIVTDDLSMAGASGEGSPAAAAVAAVKAGADLLILSSPAQEQADAYEAVVAAVESGEIPREQLENSVRRIVETKKNYPIYDQR